MKFEELQMKIYATQQFPSQAREIINSFPVLYLLSRFGNERIPKSEGKVTSLLSHTLWRKINSFSIRMVESM